MRRTQAIQATTKNTLEHAIRRHLNDFNVSVRDNHLFY